MVPWGLPEVGVRRRESRVLGGLERPPENKLCWKSPLLGCPVPAQNQLPSHPGHGVPTRYSRAPARPPPGMVVSPLSSCSPSGETAALISGPAWCGRATQGLN